MQSTDFIYFDLGNVILDFDHERGTTQAAAVSGVPLDLTREAIFDSGLQTKYETGLVTSDQFYATFCQLTNSQPDQDDLLESISDIFEPNWSILPLVTQLRARGFPIGILSNTCRAHWDFVYSRYTILRQFFEPMILSYEVNSMKPDSKIYQQAIELAGCQAKNCFFVDDKPENVEAAKLAGMDAVLYESVLALASQLSARGVGFNL